LAAFDKPDRFWASDSLRALWPDLTWDLDLEKLKVKKSKIKKFPYLETLPFPRFQSPTSIN
jgi:hypothetical protein